MKSVITALASAVLLTALATAASAHPTNMSKSDSTKTFFEEQTKIGS